MISEIYGDDKIRPDQGNAV